MMCRILLIIYGKSKNLGEVVNEPRGIILRSSTIGYELQTKYGLLERRLSQKGSCRGFSRAVFSCLPTDILRDDSFVIDRSLDSERFSRATGYRTAP